MMLREPPQSEPTQGDQDKVMLSLPEIGGLCTRAARGAGLSWGLAEECGAAAVWLAANGFESAGTVAARLTGDRGAPVVPAPGTWCSVGPVCGLCAGVTLADFAGLPEGLTAAPLTIGSVLNPLMMLPFVVHAVAIRGTSVAVYLDDDLWVSISQSIVDFAKDSAPATGTIMLCPADAASDQTHPRPTQQSVPVARADYVSLDALALRTTVPPSAQSHARAGGEGPDTD